MVSKILLKLIPMTGKVDGGAKASVGIAKDYLHPAKEADSDTSDEGSSPIEEVQMTVGTTDDPSLPCMTFRTLVLGITANIVITIINTFFGYRTEPLHVSAIVIQIAALPIGRLMAGVLPREPIGFPLIPWRFSLNPGPFNVKEHVLITTFAYTGSGAMGAMLVNVVKAFYKRKLDFIPSLLFVLATQVRTKTQTLVLP
jgi:OPT family oligopeptide transporter